MCLYCLKHYFLALEIKKKTFIAAAQRLQKCLLHPISGLRFDQAASATLNSTLYHKKRFSRNIRIVSYPDIIVFPESTYDVSLTMKCAYALSIRVCPRGGGHSYEGYSTCHKGILLDMRRIKQINVNPVTNIATISAGLNVGETYFHLWNTNNLTIPGGHCPSVGIGR